MSLAVASPNGTGLSEIDTASKTTSDGGAIVGALVSTTLTFCVSVAVLPLVSVAVHVTIVSPSGKTGGASFVIDSISPLSVAAASPKIITLSTELVASLVTSAGALITGLVVSLKVNIFFV